MSAPTFLTLHELVQKARQKLNHDNWDYIVGGAETETLGAFPLPSLAENAFY